MGIKCGIDVHSEAEGLEGADLFPILEFLMPVKFEPTSNGGRNRAAKIIFEKKTGQAKGNIDPSISSLVAPPCRPSSGDGALIKLRVRFSDDHKVPIPFRGRLLAVSVANEPRGLALADGEIVLAQTEQGVVWCVSGEKNAKHYRTAFELPVIPAHGGLQDMLNGDRFLEALPLLQFLRGICADDQYEAPPLRAQFMFDDPNLHWPSYGYVNYKELAVRAAREKYHVSFATVPLDVWATNSRAAEIFRNDAKHLSLCVHGNNHTKRELAQNSTPAGRGLLLQQAIRRIERIEKEAGIQVARVMVPPHGACSHEMLRELPRHGFESACISTGSLRAHNRSRPWTRRLGYLPSETIGGCPVLPRWGLADSNENTILLAAFLRQPIILRGHHRDLKGGLELLDGFARIVNGLGDVIWSNMSEISRLNYSGRMDGNTWRVRPLGRRLNVRVPEEATAILVESAGGQNWGNWRLLQTHVPAIEIRCDEDVPLSEPGMRFITLETVAPPSPVIEGNGGVSSVAPFLRRILTEGRDRLVGALGR